MRVWVWTLRAWSCSVPWRRCLSRLDGPSDSALRTAQRDTLSRVERSVLMLVCVQEEQVATAARFQEQLQSALEGHQGEVQQLVDSHRRQLAEQEAAYQARAAVRLGRCCNLSSTVPPFKADVIMNGNHPPLATATLWINCSALVITLTIDPPLVRGVQDVEAELRVAQQALQEAQAREQQVSAVPLQRHHRSTQKSTCGLN